MNFTECDLTQGQPQENLQTQSNEAYSFVTKKNEAYEKVNKRRQRNRQTANQQPAAGQLVFAETVTEGPHEYEDVLPRGSVPNVQVL